MSIWCAGRYGLIPSKAVELTKKHAEKGFIPKEELDEELMLILEDLKLATPIESEKGSLAWISRHFGGDMEIPYIVRFFFRSMDWRKAIVDYFTTIGENRAEEFVEIFSEIKRRAKNLIICAEDIVDITLKYDRDPGVVISELKGAGLISPTVGCGAFGRAKAPLYELNKFFALISE
ncbi:MAG: hypothetical protein ACK401_05995 [Archaeoglobaceae archaeon]